VRKRTKGRREAARPFGSLAIFAAIRRASSLERNFAADLRLICYLATLEGAAAMYKKS
jgi:hypothetical protein